MADIHDLPTGERRTQVEELSEHADQIIALTIQGLSAQAIADRLPIETNRFAVTRWRNRAEHAAAIEVARSEYASEIGRMLMAAQKPVTAFLVQTVTDESMPVNARLRAADTLYRGFGVQRLAEGMHDMATAVEFSATETLRDRVAGMLERAQRAEESGTAAKLRAIEATGTDGDDGG